MRRRWFMLRLAILNTFKRRFRAALAIGGITLSSAIMILLFGVSDGLHSLVTREVTNSDTASVITVNQRNSQQVTLDQTKISAIKSISGVADVQELVGMVGNIQYHGITVNIPLYAVSSDFFRTSPVVKVAGETEGQPSEGSIILSTEALNLFTIDTGSALKKQLQVQTTIPEEYAADGASEADRTVKPSTFAVSGVIDKGNQPIAYIPLEYIVKHGATSVSQLKVSVTYPEKIPSVRESIEQLGYQTTSIQDSIDQVNRIFAVIQRIILMFGIIALVITVFGTFNVITLTLIEETRQIGFLRLMGMQKMFVRFLFTTQAVMLTFVGAFTGSILGLLLGFAANGISKSLVGDTVFSGDVYVFTAPIVQIFIILMLSLVVGWLIGLMPAKRAVAIGPLEELRE